MGHHNIELDNNCIDSDDVMTQKISPKALILVDFQFEDNELMLLEAVADVKFSPENISELALAFGKYLAATILFWHSVLPKQAAENIETARKELSKLCDTFVNFRFEGSNALIVRSLNSLPDKIASLPLEVKNALGLRYEPSHTETGRDIDQNLAVGNLIDSHLRLATNKQIDLDYVLEILQVTLDSVISAGNDIANSGGKGGRIGDPNFTVFLVEMLNFVCPVSGVGPLSKKAAAFVDEARRIIALRLDKMGERKAADGLKKLERENTISRIRDALKEDAKTINLFRFRES